jgi:hypothetical protein
LETRSIQIKLFVQIWSHENFKVLGIDFSLDLNCIADINFTQKIKGWPSILMKADPHRL